jgi:hypothetical protein
VAVVTSQRVAHTLIALAVVLCVGCGTKHHANALATTPTNRLDPAAARVARQFIATAVTRRDLAAAWLLTDPLMRSGFTRATWLRGQIPVPKVPAAAIEAIQFKVDSSTASDLTLVALLISSRETRAIPSESFQITLHRNGRAWLVRSLVPPASMMIIPGS